MTIDELDAVIACLPQRITRVHSAQLPFNAPFLEMAQRFAQRNGTVSLMSGGTSDCARYHILGIDPWLTIRSNGSGLSMEWGSGAAQVAGPPFALLQKLLRHFELATAQYPQPICAGLLGYLSYDLKDCLEVLPRTSIDDLHLPQLYLVAPSIIIVQDRLDDSICAYSPVFGEDEAEANRRILELERALERPLQPSGPVGALRHGFRSCFARSSYLRAVAAIREYIVQGHVYQVNMSQRFEAEFEGDPYTLYARLFSQNPAAFFAYLNAGDHQVISTSPERFLLLKNGTVETRPIKGTRPRGKTPADDALMKSDLENSPKDNAELSMIVDLMRNDIGRVCRAGSIRVTQHKRLESYENVHHLVSVVEGSLDEGKDAVDLICATFPGGSITGCPKIRSMEIIDELEPVRRHIYTGSIGYISFHGTMDLSIAIRTATAVAGRLLFSVGGGVVYDSDPNDEYDETLHKGRTLLGAFDSKSDNSGDANATVWCNGLFAPSDEAVVSVADDGFLYGHGFFETIRVQSGTPSMLEQHLERFHGAWATYFDSPIPDVTWHEIIRQLVERNGLSDKLAAVKILAAAGSANRRSKVGTLLVTAKPYVHRLEGLQRNGLRICVYPHQRQSHLADHKTMNYLLYKMAGKYAGSKQADEALILNADGTISETNTANVLCVVKGVVYRPISAHVLRGTMEQAVCKLLPNWNVAVESRRLTVEDLKRADYAFLTNSLMGAVPVSHVEGQPMGDDGGLCRRINQTLLA